MTDNSKLCGVRSAKRVSTAFDICKDSTGKVLHATFQAAKVDDYTMRFTVLQNSRVLYEAELWESMCADDALDLFMCQLFGLDKNPAIQVLLEPRRGVETIIRANAVMEV